MGECERCRVRTYKWRTVEWCDGTIRKRRVLCEKCADKFRILNRDFAAELEGGGDGE